MLVVLITPPPIDEDGRKEYAQFVPIFLFSSNEEHIIDLFKGKEDEIGEKEEESEEMGNCVIKTYFFNYKSPCSP